MSRLSLLCALVALLALALPAGCRTVPGPAPEPVPEFTIEAPPPPPPPKPAEPQQFLLVTGSRVNVRQGPSMDRPAVARVKKGDRLRLVSQQGDWYEVRLADESPGFVSAKYVRRDEPCAEDSAGPQIVTPPALSFSQAGAHGVVQLRISVTATGDVSGVRVVENATGDDALATQAISEVKAMKFAPLIRRCRPTPFVYLFNRTF